MYCYFDSPVGKLLLAGTKYSLSLISFPVGKTPKKPLADWELRPDNFIAWQQQLSEYFAGQRQSFDLSYTLDGSEFQQQVLSRVAKIKYGTTKSYSHIAQEINNPRAVRAVGMANSRNNLPIVIPCHRVIGKNGKLTGFNGGLNIKQYLLNLESAAWR